MAKTALKPRSSPKQDESQTFELAKQDLAALFGEEFATDEIVREHLEDVAARKKEDYAIGTAEHPTQEQEATPVDLAAALYYWHEARRLDQTGHLTEILLRQVALELSESQPSGFTVLKEYVKKSGLYRELMFDKLGRAYFLGQKPAHIQSCDFVLPNEPPPTQAMRRERAYFKEIIGWASERALQVPPVDNVSPAAHPPAPKKRRPRVPDPSFKREATRLLGVHVPESVYRDFRMLAAKNGTTTDAMLAQALELLFQHHREKVPTLLRQKLQAKGL